MRQTHPARWIAVTAASLTLGGCFTLFPKSNPSQLYRLEAATAHQAADSPATAAAPVAANISVIRAPTSFTRGAEGDQILTANGDQVAYISGARWVAPASVLFDQAESEAFDQAATHVRLARRGEFVNGPISLRLDVMAFEARYLHGPGAPPTAVVQVRAIITRVRDRRVIAVKTFESRKEAADNRVGAIVTGIDDALTGVLSEIVPWTDAEATASATDQAG